MEHCQIIYEMNENFWNDMFKPRYGWIHTGGVCHGSNETTWVLFLKTRIYIQVVTNLKHSTIVRIILLYPVDIFVATVVLGSINTKSSLL